MTHTNSRGVFVSRSKIQKPFHNERKTNKESLRFSLHYVRMLKTRKPLILLGFKRFQIFNCNKKMQFLIVYSRQKEKILRVNP